MRASRKTWLVRIGSFVLAGGLLYLTLRNVDFDAVGAALARANYWWLVPMGLLLLASHWLRAVRWRYLLNVLPDERSGAEAAAVPGPAETDRLAFLSIMIGYMANYAGPRLGELVRAGTLSNRRKLPFSSVFGTIVVERVLDTATLAAALLTIPLIYGSESSRVREMLIDPMRDVVAGFSAGAWIAVAAVAAAGAAAAVWLLRGSANGRDEHSRLGQILLSFREGFRTLARTRRPVRVGVLTIGIWLLYGVVAWIPFVMLDLSNPYDIGLIDGWGVMLLGAIGVVVPSPGGIGSYHYITTRSLEILYAMPESTAATYALVVHTGQMLLYIAVGFAAILYLGQTVKLRGENGS